MARALTAAGRMPATRREAGFLRPRRVTVGAMGLAWCRPNRGTCCESRGCANPAFGTTNHVDGDSEAAFLSEMAALVGANLRR